ncbi:MAG: Fe-S cluster assembly protein SufD [Chitinophagaceae bacterium]|nr:Fe-S cluster assembly protein SufD [Chitinophagaceae bacterium]
MITTTTLYDRFIDLYKENETSREEGWLKNLRDTAFEAFATEGFPHIKMEDWRFTNVTPFLKENYHLQPRRAASLHGRHNAAQIPSLDAYEVVLKNGMLNEDIAIPGVKISPLRTALQNSNFQHYLGKYIPIHKHPFAALNTAFFEHGIVIEVDKKAICDKPVHITHVYNAEEPVFVQPRILIIAHPGSKVEIVESLVVIGDKPLFINSVSECYIGENARADQYNLQIAPVNTHIVNFKQTIQQSNSLYNNHTYNLPEASLIRNNLHLDLNGVNTESHLYGLYLPGGTQLTDNHTVVNHLFPNCFSNELYKGVLRDSSRGVFSGRIYVHQDAQKTNAFQQNNNILFSDNATIDSKPQLEIFADDVKCSHGSTVGSLNKEALFYLRSRGIGEAAARNLLVRAFAFDVTDKIQIPAVKDYIEQVIIHKMEETHHEQ